MRILAIDTSGRDGGVALCRGDATSFEVLGATVIDGGTYSARLMPCIVELLCNAELDKSQIDGFVVVDGPGSFTGLRVGLATVKGLCDALTKPLATVSMLEALAITYGSEGESLSAVLDAGRGEVYVGTFNVADGRAKLQDQAIEKLADLLPRISASQTRVITTSAKIAGATLVSPVEAGTIGRIGLRKLLEGEAADPATLDANYIRRSDAELYSLPKN